MKKNINTLSIVKTITKKAPVRKTVAKTAAVLTQFPRNQGVTKVSGLVKAMYLDLDSDKLTTTGNGAITPSTTGTAVLDFFSIAGAIRTMPESDVTALYDKAFFENPLLALKALFYFRDIRGGQGERKVFRTLLKYLAKNQKASLKKNLLLIPELGRWDDVLELLDTPLETEALTLINNQIATDLTVDRPSLAAKWLPSINASNKECKEQGRQIAKFLGLSERNYRKVLSHLRAKINILERQLCSKDWSSINYEHVPSRASLLYRKAFSKHDKARYSTYLSQVVKGTKKINASTLYPYDIVRAAVEGNATAEALWANQIDYLAGSKGNRLVIADVSGSMTDRAYSPMPIDVCISLTLYLAERNTGLFKNAFITFSSTPKLEIVNGSTLYERISNLSRAHWTMGTDFQAAFNLILDTAVRNRIPQKEMPTQIIAISDMQFNVADRNKLTNYEAIQKKYKAAGYKMPQLVFWNVAGRKGQAPVTANEENTVLISGCSPSIMSDLLGIKETTPYQKMLDVLNKPRYDKVRA